MLNNTSTHCQKLQVIPREINKHAEKNTFIVTKIVEDADFNNLILEQNFILARKDLQNKIQRKVDSSFQMRIQSINNVQTLLVKSSYFSGQSIPFRNHAPLKQIIKQLINEMIRGNNQYFYTHDNVKLDPFTHEIYTNITSNLGLQFLLRKKSLLKKQFAEIYQLLNPGMFQEKDLKDKLHFKIKFRAIAFFILSFALGTKLNLFFEIDNFDSTITYEEAKKPVSLLFDRYVQLLSNKRIMKKIREFQDRDKANYALFLKRVFLDQCKGLTWNEVISLLVFRYKSVKTHNNIFIDFADQLFQIEESKQFWQELGLGDPSQRQWYLIAKLGVNISKIIQFQSFEEYIRTEKNWNEDKERVCMVILQLLNKLQQYYKKRRQTKENLEGEQYFITQDEERLNFNSIFTRFSQIYKIVQSAIGYYRAKVNQTQIKYMSNEKRILTKYLNL